MSAEEIVDSDRQEWKRRAESLAAELATARAERAVCADALAAARAAWAVYMDKYAHVSEWLEDEEKNMVAWSAALATLQRVLGRGGT